MLRRSRRRSGKCFGCAWLLGVGCTKLPPCGWWLAGGFELVGVDGCLVLLTPPPLSTHAALHSFENRGPTRVGRKKRRAGTTTVTKVPKGA
jgi:hypothetical protein